MKIELIKIDEITPYARNPRINAHAVEKIEASLKEFGFRQPIVTDSNYVIVAGHVRYAAAKRLGLKKVPVHVASELTPAQIKAYRIADNKLAEVAEWDKSLLQIEIAELDAEDYNTELLGFSVEELKDIQTALDDLVNDGFGEDDEEEIAEADTTARIGSYSFTIERERYLDWLEKLNQEAGFEKKDIIAELQKRLGL